MAAKAGHVDIVKMALTQQKDEKYIRNAMEISLHEAAKHGFIEVVSSLLEHGVDIESKMRWEAQHCFQLQIILK